MNSIDPIPAQGVEIRLISAGAVLNRPPVIFPRVDSVNSNVLKSLSSKICRSILIESREDEAGYGKL